MVSTISSAGWPAASIARRTAAMSEVTPVDVSLCTTHTALMRCAASARRRCSIRSACTPRRQLFGRPVSASMPGSAMNSGCEPEALRHLLPQRREVAGLVHQHRVAGAQRVDQRRLPRAGARRGIDDDRMARLEDLLDAGEHLPAERAELRPRWSMVGWLIARRMRSGTGLGPGICRKWRPAGWKFRLIMDGVSMSCSGGCLALESRS